MKSVTPLSKRFRISLTLLATLALLPLGSTFQSAQAKPKSGAPAYGYRAKNSKMQKRRAKRERRQAKRQARRDRRNDRNGDYRNDRNGDYRNDRNDNYRNDDDYRNDRNGDYPNDDYQSGNYGSGSNDIEARVREYSRIFRNR